jgi:hypothetical protein
MVSARCPDQQIQDVMFDKGLPIGEHVREQPNPVDYLVRQIRHALAKIGGADAVIREIKIKARMEERLTKEASKEPEPSLELENDTISGTLPGDPSQSDTNGDPRGEFLRLSKPVTMDQTEFPTGELPTPPEVPQPIAAGLDQDDQS